MIAQQGNSRIVVQLPEGSDPGRIKKLLGQTAKMTFHLVGDRTLLPGTLPPPGYQWLPMAEDGSRRGPILVSTR